MKFIKLTEVRQTEDIEFFVRPSNIVCIQKSSSAFANAIVDIDGSISKWVKETPEEIMEMINGKPETTDEELREMMKDPKYWKDQDPEYVKKIENGFKKLYGNKD